jgi:hypothetical protein
MGKGDGDGESQGSSMASTRPASHNPALQNATPLFLAACNGHTAVSRLLVHAGASAGEARALAAKVRSWSLKTK